jgi:hypothetical protein
MKLRRCACEGIRRRAGVSERGNIPMFEIVDVALFVRRDLRSGVLCQDVANCGVLACAGRPIRKRLNPCRGMLIPRRIVARARSCPTDSEMSSSCEVFLNFSGSQRWYKTSAGRGAKSLFRSTKLVLAFRLLLTHRHGRQNVAAGGTL